MSINSKTSLDFVIIGTQKAGTTTLFQYLNKHPAIYMPSEKEAIFFCHDERYEKGWNWFVQEFFANAPQDKLWGKATPHYMCSSQVPERLAKQFPQVKLIAILREPVARAYSQYKMNVRRGVEPRSFEEVIQSQLKLDSLEEARLSFREDNSYVMRGEYGRILSQYLHYFPREQLLVLFTDDLEHRPEDLMRQIYSFLNVEAKLPKNLGRKFHLGGTRQRLPQAKWLIRKTPMRVVWRLLSPKTRRRLGYWFDQWNTLPGKVTQPTLTLDTLKALKEHYQSDSAVLQSVIQKNPPWALFPETKRV